MRNLLIIALLFGLIFWLSRGFDRSGRARDGQRQELVPDALTGVYFAKNQAISITRGGETLYFQSVENRDKFLASRR